LKAGPLKKAAAPPTKEQPRKAAVSVAVVAAVVAAVPLEDRKVPVSSAADFFAKRQERTGAQEDFAGGEHDLLRLMKQGNMVVQNKGRQRIKPRKKQFSALKKRVLEERLHNWQELHPEEAPNAAAPDGLGTALEAQTCSVCVYGYAELEDLEDDDEYQELVDNLRELASKVGPVQQVFMPRALPDRSVDKYPSFVEFASPQHASAAVTCWHGLVVGGQSLACLALVQAQAEDMDWQDWCLAAETLSTDTTNNVAAVSAEVILESALTEDDLEDEDCLEESVNDIRALAEKYGTVQDIRVEMEPAAHLIIVYAGGLSVARKAAQELGKIVIGGQAVSSRVLGLDAPPQTASSCECSIILRNLLTEDDLEDEDCLEESLNDAKELASKFGTVLGVSLEPDDEAGAVKIRFSSTTDGGKSAVDGFDGMVVGGQTVSAVILEGLSTGYVRDTGPSIDSIPDPPTPLFSGDKRIPERFAECKRVPKIPNSGTPRKYATLVDDDSVKPLLIEMLGELMRLQRRAIENNNTKTKRRLVMGLREVARGIRSHKVKMVVMANNLDEYGVIDDKLQEILDLAHEEGVAVFFDLSKRGLGKAIGKTIKIAVVGVQNNDGAHQQFKKLVTLAPKAT
jgi:selenocysteine insertion sequence-binding protein 2